MTNSVFNKDNLTTASGIGQGIAVLSQVDYNKVAEKDPNSIANVVLGAILMVWGFLTNKGGKDAKIEQSTKVDNQGK